MAIVRYIFMLPFVRLKRPLIKFIIVPPTFKRKDETFGGDASVRSA